MQGRSHGAQSAQVLPGDRSPRAGSLLPRFGRSPVTDAAKKGRIAFGKEKVVEAATTIDGAFGFVLGPATHVPDAVRLDWSTAEEEVREFGSRGAVLGRCTCARFRSGRACEHMWAVVYALDALAPESIPGTFPLYLDPDPDFEDPELLAVHGDYVAEVLQRATRTPGGMSASYSLSAWFERIERRARAARADGAPLAPPAAQRERRLSYVIDLDQTVRRQELVIELHAAPRLKAGGFGKLTPLRLGRNVIESIDSAADRENVAVLLGMYAESAEAYLLRPMTLGQTPARFAFNPAYFDLLLPRLAASGRLCIARRNAPEGELEGPLAWDAGAPWRFRLTLGTSLQESTWTLGGVLYRDDEERPVASARLLLPSGLVLWDNQIGRFDPDGSFDWINHVREAGGLEVAADDRDEVLGRLLSMDAVPRLRVPAESGWSMQTGTPRLRVEITTPQGDRAEAVRGSLSIDYGGLVIDPRSQARTVADRDNRIWLERDPKQEEELRDRLPFEAPGGVIRLNSFDSWELLLRRSQLPLAIRMLVDAGCDVVTDGRALRRSQSWNLAVTSGIDWFELEGRVDFGGASASIAEILASRRRGDTFIQLGDGSTGMLADEWLERIERLAKLGETQGDGVRFKMSQASVLDAMLGDSEVRVDATFARVRERLRSFDGIEAAPAAAGFEGELREYQRFGLGWLNFLMEFGFGGCLADDMGLGKTVQVLALLQARHVKGAAKAPSLVVVPRSLLHNWMDEAARFTPQLRALDLTGLGRHGRRSEIAHHDIILTTYGTLRRDAESLSKIEFSHVILDEATAIKNPASVSAKACRVLRAQHRLALTGTPVENHIGELWSIFEFLNPGMLGAARVFQTVDVSNTDGAERETLLRALRPFILRRTKDQVLQELPAKTEQTIHCEMDAAQKRFYDRLRDHFRSTLGRRIEHNGLAKSKIHVLEALLRLRQAACHPGLVDEKEAGATSCKLEALEEQLGEIVEGGHKAIVFSQFTKFLALVRTRLDALGIPYEYLDGRTRDRRARVVRFQEDPNCPVFLISLKAGGHGLNLTAADYVFILDPWWNPAVEAQAIDRAHRIGQVRNVFAYRLITRGTVEEKILELQAQKRHVADAILKQDSSVLRSLTAEDLRLLLE